MIFSQDNCLLVRLVERWFKRDGQLSDYCNRPPFIEGCLVANLTKAASILGWSSAIFIDLAIQANGELEIP